MRVNGDHRLDGVPSHQSQIGVVDTSGSQVAYVGVAELMGRRVQASRQLRRHPEPDQGLLGTWSGSELIRLSDEDYRMYSGAIRWYAAEVIHRVYGAASTTLDSKSPRPIPCT